MDKSNEVKLAASEVLKAQVESQLHFGVDLPDVADKSEKKSEKSNSKKSSKDHTASVTMEKLNLPIEEERPLTKQSSTKSKLLKTTTIHMSTDETI